MGTKQVSSSKCRVCREPAIIDLPRHNAHFCADHLVQFCRRQVAKAISDHDMFGPDDRVLVAVSGGKDSLAVWDLLVELGYSADGLYIGLGIGEYSDSSYEFTRAFADERGLALTTVDLRDDLGYDVPTAAKVTRRVPCSACGLSKRHLFDRAAIEGGYDVVVTGHNLDDEAAVLFGNTLHWDIGYLARQLPVLPAEHGFPRKAKPLVRLAERETAAWCIVRGIDYQIDECPMAIGNKHLAYKEALNSIERMSPGSKASFYLEFVDKMAPLLAEHRARDRDRLVPCVECGSTTTEPDSGDEPRCAFCRLRERVVGAEPVPVDLVVPKRARRARRLAARTDGQEAT
ncbi:MAG: tRNA(Ile)-lysidine synthetase [Ilumatobacteraceae bacterium]